MHASPTLLFVLLAATIVGCVQSPEAAGCEEPVAVSFEALSSVSCDERADTGYRAGDAFDITVVTVDGRPVERGTANAYYVMAEAAARDGVEIRIVSGFRTMAEQEYFYHCYTSCSCNDCNLAARPGYSNHQSGHALDLNTRAAGVLTWLNAHGAEFGFERTVPSEAWHWEWWGGGPGGGPCPACRAHCEGTVLVGDDCGRGDCAAFGSRCVDDALGARCAFFACPDTGDATVCIDERTIGNCHDGAVSTGDCSMFAAYCSTAGAASARCVSAFCVSSATEAPVEHDTCLPDGQLAHCDASGAPTAPRACEPGTTCTITDGVGRCTAPPPEPAPDASTPPPDAARPDAGTTTGEPPTREGPPSRHGIGQACSVARPGARDGGAGTLALVAGLLLIAGRRRRNAATRS